MLLGRPYEDTLDHLHEVVGRPGLGVLLAVVLVGCGGPPSSPADLPNAATSSPAAAIELRYMPADQVCPLARVPRVTFRIDPTAGEQVWAVQWGGGTRWMVSWSVGFQGGTAGDPVVRDPSGRIVARNGDVLDFSGEFPKLAGYTVCAGLELYVFLDGPD